MSTDFVYVDTEVIEDNVYYYVLDKQDNKIDKYTLDELACITCLVDIANLYTTMARVDDLFYLNNYFDIKRIAKSNISNANWGSYNSSIYFNSVADMPYLIKDQINANLISELVIRHISREDFVTMRLLHNDINIQNGIINPKDIPCELYYFSSHEETYDCEIALKLVAIDDYNSNTFRMEILYTGNKLYIAQYNMSDLFYCNSLHKVEIDGVILDKPEHFEDEDEDDIFNYSNASLFDEMFNLEELKFNNFSLYFIDDFASSFSNTRLKKITFDGIIDFKPKDLSYCFNQNPELIELDMTNLDLSAVKYFEGILSNNNKLKRVKIAYKYNETKVYNQIKSICKEKSIDFIEV